MLEIVLRANGAVVEGITDRNGHLRKEVGEGGSVSWGGARTKGEGRECTPKICSSTVIFLHFCLHKNGRLLSSSLKQQFKKIKTHVTN